MSDSKRDFSAEKQRGKLSEFNTSQARNATILSTR